MPDEPQDMTEEESGEAAAPSKSKLSLKTLILIGLPLVLVQAVIGFLVVSKFIEPKLPESKPPPEEEMAVETRLGEEQDLSDYVTFPVEDIIVNPAETGGQRYLNVSITVYIPSEVAEAFAEFEPEIKALVIERISRKRLDELDDSQDQQILSEEIRGDLNSTLNRYFSSKFPGLVIPRVRFHKYTIQ